MKERKPGRPKLGNKKKKFITLSLRILKSDAEKIRKLALDQNLTVSKWIKSQIAHGV